VAQISCGVRFQKLFSASFERSATARSDSHVIQLKHCADAECMTNRTAAAFDGLSSLPVSGVRI
jgi:hypothetical protein